MYDESVTAEALNDCVDNSGFSCTDLKFEGSPLNPASAEAIQYVSTSACAPVTNSDGQASDAAVINGNLESRARG